MDKNDLFCLLVFWEADRDSFFDRQLVDEMFKKHEVNGIEPKKLNKFRSFKNSVKWITQEFEVESEVVSDTVGAYVVSLVVEGEPINRILWRKFPTEDQEQLVFETLDLQEEIEEKYNIYCNSFTSVDMNYMLNKFMKSLHHSIDNGMTSYLSRRGMHLIDKLHTGKILKLQNAINDIGIPFSVNLMLGDSIIREKFDIHDITIKGKDEKQKTEIEIEAKPETKTKKKNKTKTNANKTKKEKTKKEKAKVEPIEPVSEKPVAKEPEVTDNVVAIRPSIPARPAKPGRPKKPGRTKKQTKSRS